MAAGSIIIDLLFKTGSFETDTKRAEKRLKELKKEAADAGKAIGAGLVVAGTAAAAFVKNAIDSADAASKAAQAAGITTEAYTGLAYAAGLAGVEQETLGKAYSKLNTDIASNDATLRKLGVALRDASGNARSADAVLEDLADRFAGMTDGPEKAAIAAKIFGERIGPQLLPFLNQGKAGISSLRDEARKLGIEISTETGKAAEEFNDNLTRLQTVASGFATQLAAQMLPTLVQLSERFVQNAKDVGLLQGAFLTFFEKVFGGTGLSDVANKKLGAIQESIGSLQDEINDRAAAGDTARVEVLSRELAQLEAQAAAIKAQVGFAKELEDGAKKPDARPDPKPPPKGIVGDKEKISDAQRYLESLRQQLAGIGDLTEAQKVLTEIEVGRLKSSTKGEQERALAFAREIDATREAQRIAQERAEFRKKEEEAIAQATEAAVEADKRRLEALTTGAFERKLAAIISDVEFLNQAFEDGKISVEVWADSVRDATSRLEKSSEELDEFQKNLAQNLQSYFGDQLQQAMEGNFKDIGKAFASMVNRMIAEAVAADLTKKLLGQAAGGSGEGWLSGLFAAFGSSSVGSGAGAGAGASLGAAFSGSGANGVDTSPNRSYWVGEDGPEMFVPRTAGKVVPPAGGGNVTVINNTGVRAEARTERNGDGTMRVFLDRVKGEIAADYARGGPLARAQESIYGSRRAPQLAR